MLNAIRVALMSALSCLVLVMPAFAGYNVQVTKLPEFDSRVKSVALSPADCPEGLDCVWIEDRLLEDLKRYASIDVVPPSRVRQVMLELEINQVDETSRPVLAEHLHVDSFLIPLVGHASEESAGSISLWSGYSMTTIDDTVAKGRVELLVVGGTDGKVLLRGTGFGESDLRSQKGVIRKIFRQVLIKAFTKPEE